MAITVQLIGGLGNQLFQYAGGRTLANRHKTKLFLDATGYNITEQKKYQKKSRMAGRDYELKPFAIKVDGVAPRAIKKSDNYFSHTHLSFNKKFFSLPYNVYVKSYFQSYHYLHPIKDALVNMMAITKNLSPQTMSWLKKIKKTPSIFVHLRRGDYLRIPKLGILEMDYYQQAITMMKEKIPMAHFFVFSDDPIWVKKNLAHCFQDYKKVDCINHNQGRDSWQDLFLMSACRHAIIANSSFSLWSAYILWFRQQKEKKTLPVVIAPKNWFYSVPAKTSDLFPPDWYLLQGQKQNRFAIYRRSFSRKVKDKFNMIIKNRFFYFYYFSKKIKGIFHQ